MDSIDRKRVVLSIPYAESMRLIRANLRAAGYEVVTEAGYAEVLEELEGPAKSRCDLAVIGEQPKDYDTVEFLRLFRIKSDVPLIMMAGAVDSIGAAAALNAGADDFLSYPYSAEEFLARAASVIRRAYKVQADETKGKMVLGALTIDTNQRRVIIRGKVVALTPIEYGILYYLAERVDRVVSHGELLSHIWGPEYETYIHYLRVGVGRLRQKIEKVPSAPVHLVTCSGVGYMLRDIKDPV